jgi:hypothetical protein
VQNSGKATLLGPALELKPATPESAGAFSMSEKMSGGELDAGRSAQVELRFTPPSAGEFSALLNVGGHNLQTPRSLRITGTGVVATDAGQPQKGDSTKTTG